MSDLKVTYNDTGTYAMLHVRRQSSVTSIGSTAFAEGDPATNKIIRRVMAELGLWDEAITVEPEQIIITLGGSSNAGLSNDVQEANAQLAGKTWGTPYYKVKQSDVFPDEFTVRLGAPLWTKDERALQKAGVLTCPLDRQPHPERTLWRMVRPAFDEKMPTGLFNSLDYSSSRTRAV
jgi:hypothetical protein